MNNEQNFKKGDKVRVKSTDIEDIVIDVCNGNVFLKNNGYWSAKALELIEPHDRRTAFLMRLQSLMREYDAMIECWQSDFESVAMAINIGDDTVEYDSGDKSNLISITPDNIMDFDKE